MWIWRARPPAGEIEPWSHLHRVLGERFSNLNELLRARVAEHGPRILLRYLRMAHEFSLTYGVGARAGRWRDPCRSPAAGNARCFYPAGAEIQRRLSCLNAGVIAVPVFPACSVSSSSSCHCRGFRSEICPDNRKVAAPGRRSIQARAGSEESGVDRDGRSLRRAAGCAERFRPDARNAGFPAIHLGLDRRAPGSDGHAREHATEPRLFTERA